MDGGITTRHFAPSFINSNASFSPMLERVRAYCRVAEQVYEETGHRAVYCPNITDRPEKIVENARRAQELGAGMVMINAVTAGLGAIQAVAEDPQVTIPILSHYAGAGTMVENPRAGIASPLLLGKLARLAGADTSMFGSVYSSYPLLREKYLRTAHFQRMPLYDLKPALPCVGGGIHPGDRNGRRQDRSRRIAPGSGAGLDDRDRHQLQAGVQGRRRRPAAALPLG